MQEMPLYKTSLSPATYAQGHNFKTEVNICPLASWYSWARTRPLCLCLLELGLKECGFSYSIALDFC